MTANPYTFTHNSMEVGVANCNPDLADQNLEYLYWQLSNGSGGGVVEFDDKGAISANFTLTANKITLGAITGLRTLTLPTVTDTSKQVTCILDFSTDNTGLTLPSGLKWANSNGGKAPPSYSIISGVRNILTFKTIVVSGAIVWEAEYTSYGGVETTFTQPNLTSNGTFGGSDFAVRASSQQAGYEAFRASDGSTSTFWGPNGASPLGHYYEWSNPVAIKVTQYNITNHYGDQYGAYAITAGNTYYSDDGVNWFFEQSFTNSVIGGSGTWAIPVSIASQGYYKCRRLVPTATSNGYQPLMAEGKLAGYTITT